MDFNMYVMNILGEWEKVKMIGPIPSSESPTSLFIVDGEFGIFVVDGREIYVLDEEYYLKLYE